MIATVKLSMRLSFVLAVVRSGKYVDSTRKYIISALHFRLIFSIVACVCGPAVELVLRPRRRVAMCKSCETSGFVIIGSRRRTRLHHVLIETIATITTNIATVPPHQRSSFLSVLLPSVHLSSVLGRVGREILFTSPFLLPVLLLIHAIQHPL